MISGIGILGIIIATIGGLGFIYALLNKCGLTLSFIASIITTHSLDTTLLIIGILLLLAGIAIFIFDKSLNKRPKNTLFSGIGVAFGIAFPIFGILLFLFGKSDCFDLKNTASGIIGMITGVLLAGIGITVLLLDVRHIKKRHPNLGFVSVNVITSIVLAVSMLFTPLFYVLGYTDLSEESSNNNANDKSLADSNDLKKNESEDVTYFLVAGLDKSEMLTDIMMVVCFDHKNNNASILQIPRDTYIDETIPYPYKANACYQATKDGESNIHAAIRYINDYFGLPIDHYVTTTFDGFSNIVNAMGGIDVYVEKAFSQIDSHHGDHDYEVGVNHLNGPAAEAYIRHRKSYATGDLGRVNAQRNFYAGFVKKALSLSTTSLFSVATACLEEIKTDMSIGALLGYAQQAQHLSMKNIVIYGVPGQSYWDRANNKPSYYSIHKLDYVNLINTCFLPYSAKITADDLKVVELVSSITTNEIADSKALNSYLGNEDNKE